jgi:hypothetical protein
MWSDLLTTAVCIPFVVRFFKEIPKEDQVVQIDLEYQKLTGKRTQRKSDDRKEDVEKT